MRCQVLKINHLSGVGKVSGKAYAMDIATCVVSTADGDVAAGEIVLPDGHGVKEGATYEMRFRPAMFKGRIEFQVSGLVPTAQVKAA